MSTSHAALALLTQVNAALQPREPMVRDLEIVTRDAAGKEKVWYGREARRTFGKKNEMLLVLDAPESVRGFAVLAVSGSDDTHDMWAYVPPVERVRKLEYVGMAQPFLGTDFTFADLGLFHFSGGDVRIAGHDVVGGKSVDIVEILPSDRHPYARVLTYVTPDGWPIRTEYWDAADRPWRVLTYIAAPNGNEPRLRGLVVKDKQTGYESELRYGEAHNVSDLSDDLFDPAALARVAQEQSLRALTLSDRSAREAAEADASAHDAAKETASPARNAP